MEGTLPAPGLGRLEFRPALAGLLGGLGGSGVAGDPGARRLALSGSLPSLALFCGSQLPLTAAGR